MNTNDTKGLIHPIGEPPLNPSDVFTAGYASVTSESTTPNHILGVDCFQTIKEIDPIVKKLVNSKQSEYSKKAILHKRLHYVSLTTGAVLGIATPFLIPYDTIIAQLSSIAVVVLISFDQIFRPKEKWALYSKATDLLQLQLFKMSGAYESNKEVIETIINTEAQILSTVPDLKEVLQQVKDNKGNNAI